MLSLFQRWVRQPQNVWFRRVFLQVHLWGGIGVGLYVLMISVTGSILVYSNELYRASTPKPIFSTASLPFLTDEQLVGRAQRSYPGYKVSNLWRMRNPDQAVDIRLYRDGGSKDRLFDPRTGNDLGPSVPLGMRMVSGIQDLHDNLLAGPTGRAINGVGAIATLIVASSGLVIWWPGLKTWRRSLVIHRGVGWKRMVWDLHSMIGFWSFAFILVFALSGLYLSGLGPIEEIFDDIASCIPNGDRATYWLAILHFGRINGIGFVCHSRGICDQTVKAIWAFFGLAPAAMFVTAAIMWWNRVLRPRWLSIYSAAT